MKGVNACDTELLDNSLQFRLSTIKEIEIFSLQKSMKEKRRVRHLVSISQQSIMMTIFCLFWQVQAEMFLFSQLLLSSAHLLGY